MADEKSVSELMTDFEHTLDMILKELHANQSRVSSLKWTMLAVTAFYFPMQIAIWSSNSSVYWRVSAVIMTVVLVFCCSRLQKRIDMYEDIIASSQFQLYRNIIRVAVFEGVFGLESTLIELVRSHAVTSETTMSSEDDGTANE